MICAITGLVLTLFGTVLAGKALWDDWRAHSGGAPLIPAVPRGRRWFVRHVLRRKPEVHTVSADLTAQWDVAAATGEVYVRPPVDAPVDVQLRFVRQYLIALETRIGKERQEVDQRIGRVQEAGQLADARAQTAIAKVEAKVREVATGSVRMELGGLFLVGIGSIISTLPAVFGWH